MKRLFSTIFIFTIIAIKIYAVRPFITDDAAVVGRGLIQLETWTLFQKNSGEHWIMWAYGPSDKLEVAIGAIYGYNHQNFTFAVPLLEAKYLFHEYQSGKLPGIALATGTFLPAGKGAFVPSGYGAYGFLALTQCFGQDENVLIHGNLGVNYLRNNNENRFIGFWGLGTQIRTYKGWHLVGEIMSGDPYVPGTGLTYQTGVRYFVNDNIQLDATVGQGIAGEQKVPFWWGVGARFVFEKKQK